MARKDFVMKLAKLLIGAAWADGELSNEEVNSMKDLLFTLPDLDGSDWRQLDMYMDAPVSAEETQALLAGVLDAIRSEADKALVLETLCKLFESDGEITPEETELLEQIESAVSKAPAGILGLLTKAFKSAIGLRSDRCRATSLREDRFEDYVKNTVYYQLESEMQRTGTRLDLPEEKLRTICLATGLLARVAHTDEEISDDERRSIREIIAADWGLTGEQAGLLVRIACHRATKGLDYFRLAIGYYECTMRQERMDFVKTLFKIANASQTTSNEEIEMIRKIAKSLRLDHSEFIEAKLSIRRKDRRGL